MSENVEELKKQFIKLAQRHNQQLGSVLRVCCEVKPDIKKGILILSPEPSYASVLTEHAATIDKVSRQVFGKTMVMAITLQGKQGEKKAGEAKQETAESPIAPTEVKDTASTDRVTTYKEVIEYLLDSMYLRSKAERKETTVHLKAFITRSMAVENVVRRNKEEKETKDIRDLKIYRIPAIIQESHDMSSLKRSLKKYLGKGSASRVSAFARLCGPFPWNWSFDAGVYLDHGQKRFLGTPRSRFEFEKAQAKNGEAKPGLYAVKDEENETARQLRPVEVSQATVRNRPADQESQPVPAPAADHAPADTGKSPREIALEEEIGKLRDRIDYFERLFEDHIHDVRTGQPYRPVKLGLVSSDKPA